jgi:hypothetical protein
VCQSRLTKSTWSSGRIFLRLTSPTEPGESLGYDQISTKFWARFKSAWLFTEERDFPVARIWSREASPDAEANVLSQELHIHTCQPCLLCLFPALHYSAMDPLGSAFTWSGPSVGVQASSFPFACLKPRSPHHIHEGEEWK